MIISFSEGNYYAVVNMEAKLNEIPFAVALAEIATLFMYDLKSVVQMPANP